MEQLLKFTDFLFFTAIALLLFKFYKWATKYNTYFNNRGIAYLKPIFFFGNTGKSFFMDPNEFVQSIYTKFPHEK